MILPRVNLAVLWVLLLLGGIGACLPVVQAATMQQTQAQLQALEKKIDALQRSLAHAQDKQGLLNRELAQTEKKIKTATEQTQSIKKTLERKQQEVTQIQQQINQTDEQLHHEQRELAHQIQLRYQIGEQQPLKWIINQDTPYHIDRILTLYQYILQDKTHRLEKINTLQHTLAASRETLNHELKIQQQLQQKLVTQKTKLEQEKRYKQTLLRSLKQDIQTGQITLEEYQRNRANLSRLLQSLAQRSTAFTQQNFSTLRRHLPKPVKSTAVEIKKLNQGVAFYTKAGELVHAVSAGKVVFSDWLKGYGLLLILDHGQGFMTLYAHNQTLTKHKGEVVNAGETIATVGQNSETQKNSLYFEVRYRGKALPPMEWLS